MLKVRKAVILAAGYGTRFLPATKAMPKEMLPVVDKPVIQYVVEDAVAAGIKDIVIVTSSQKRSLEDHFDHSFELEEVLTTGGKLKELEEVRAIAEMANFIYVRQKGNKGTMPALACGYNAIGAEPFLGLWGDDFFIASPSRGQQLVAAYEKYGAPVVATLESTDPEHTKRFAYASGEEVEPGIIKIKEIIEKPGPGRLDSNHAVIGGAIYTPELMAYADKIAPMANGEYVYADAIAAYLADGHPAYAVRINNGRYYDCGNKLEYVKANIELTLAREDLGPALREYLKTIKL